MYFYKNNNHIALKCDICGRIFYPQGVDCETSNNIRSCAELRQWEHITHESSKDDSGFVDFCRNCKKYTNKIKLVG